MIGNKSFQSEKGYGCFIDDTGILIEQCVFNANNEGGLFVDCHPKPMSG